MENLLLTIRGDSFGSEDVVVAASLASSRVKFRRSKFNAEDATEDDKRYIAEDDTNDVGAENGVRYINASIAEGDSKDNTEKGLLKMILMAPMKILI